MILYLPLLVFLIGILMYFIATKPEIKEIGHICIWCGLLAFLLTGGQPLVHLIK